MSSRLISLPRLVAIFGLLTLAGLASAQASRAAAWGELGHFGDKSGELNRPETAFGVNPEDGSAWVVDSTTVSGHEVFRIQKFEAGKVVASRTFKATRPVSEPELEVEGVAFDASLHRAYVLVDEERAKAPGKEEQAASELWAFSTATSGGKIEPAAETNEGLLVERTDETLTGTPVGQTKFAPQDKEKGLSLIAPGGIAVNPTNHEILITGWIGAEVPTMWAVSQKGKIEAVWEDKAAFFEKCGCLNSPVVTAAGHILALGEEPGEIYELPSSLNSETSAKRVVWLPTSKFECEILEKEAKEGKKVETCPFIEKLTEIDSGSNNLGGEMAIGPEGNLYVHVKIPDEAEGGNLFGGVMVLNPSLEELGWTGGGSSASESKSCAVNETGLGGAGPALIGASSEHVFMFERGEPLAEQTRILELGAGGTTSGCPKGSATQPSATAGGIPLNSFPITDKVAFSSKVTQANALSTEWEFEPGVKETVSKRQQETTLVEHKFAKEGKFTVVEKIHTDDLATPVIETSVKVTILGPPKVRGEQATPEGTSAALKAEVDPNLQLTECEFQYGPVGEPFNGAGIKKVACPEPPGEGEEFVAESVKISGLEGGKEYHFRLFAKAGEVKTEPEGTKFLVKETGAPEAETLAATGVASTTATLNGKVNPEGVETNCKFEYGETTSYGKEAPCASAPGNGSTPVSVSASVASLNGNTTYHFRIVAENTSKKKGVGTDKELKTTEAAKAPTVTAGTASAVTQTGATLKGTVNPNGEAVTSCEFLYGTTVSYGKAAPCASSPGNGHGAVEVTAAVTGLEAGKEYHYKLAAKNAIGEAEGTDVHFMTLAKLPPTAQTLGASAVTQTTATITGKVDPKGETTTCKFVYGATIAYGKETPCATSPGGGSGAVEVSAAISGLSPSTVYHYKLIAEGGGSKAEGLDAELTTAPVPTPPGGGTSPAPAGNNPPPPGGGVKGFTEASPTVSISGSALMVAPNGSFSLKLSCPAGETQCAGTVTIKTLTAVAASSAHAAKKAILTLASASFTVAGGKLKVMFLHLTAKARKLLAKLHTVRGRVTIAAHNPTGGTHVTTAVVTLKAVKKKH